MSPANTHASAHWAVSQVVALIGIWALIAEHSGVVGAWRLTGVCKSAREGVMHWLAKLPGMVVCGGFSNATLHTTGRENTVWRLSLATLRWETLSALNLARSSHACCTVRGSLVVLGGMVDDDPSGNPKCAEVELLAKGGGAFVNLPLMSCGGTAEAVALTVNESDSEKGQVLLLGGSPDSELEPGEGLASVLTVLLVDLATGECAPYHPSLPGTFVDFAAGQLPDGRIVFAGRSLGYDDYDTAYVAILEPPAPGASQAWTWRQLPLMIDEERSSGACGCVMSDGRFAVLGGLCMGNGTLCATASCEVMVLRDDDGHVNAVDHWEALPPMREARQRFACTVLEGCIIVAGGSRCKSAEIYEEASGRWRRLPFDLPDALVSTGCTVL